MDQGVKSRSDGKAHQILMLDEGVESCSEGVHRIHWKRIDSDGKVHFLQVKEGQTDGPCWKLWKGQASVSSRCGSS